MKCSQVMKRGIAMIRPEDNLHTAARKMRERGVGFLPVVDALGRPVGTLTDRDIAVRSVARDDKPSRVQVDRVMSIGPVTCGDMDDLRRAEELMRRHQISRIICVNEAGMLVGVISLSDILDADPSDVAAEVMRDVAHREARPTVV